MHFLTVAGLGALLSMSIAGAAQAQERVNALGFSNGTVLISYTGEYGDRASSQWIALALIDEDPALGWASPQMSPYPHEFVFELPQPYTLDSVSFDSAQTEETSGYEGVSARDVTVAVSETGPEGPWSTAYEGTLDPAAVTEAALSSPVAARWVKLVINGNGGRDDYTELMEFSAFGTAIGERVRPDNIAGTFSTNWAGFYVQVAGGKLRGCYNHDNGRFSGAYEDGFINIEWRETGDQSGDQDGQAVMSLTADGQYLAGFWYEDGARQGTWLGKREPDDNNAPECAADLIAKAETRSAVEQALDESGRAVLHGIYFDLDSDVLKPESTDTLNQILTWMQANPAKAVRFAGHTDSQGEDAYNLDLSQRRAASVVAWLSEKGIPADRMAAEGFGEGQPVADNGNPSGRALNRRVEVSLD